MTHPDAFYIFSKRQNMAQNGKKFCLTQYLRNCTSYDCGFWYTCVKWWYLQRCCSFFKILIFWVFSKFINNCQKGILRCAPPSSHICNFFVQLKLILSQKELSNLPQIVPKSKIVTILFVMFYQFIFIWPSQYALAFWKVCLWARSF